MLSGQTLLVTPSLTCLLAANYHLKYPRPAPTWPCSSDGEQPRSVREVVGSAIPPRLQMFSLSPCGLISFKGLSLRRCRLGYFYSTSTYHTYHYIHIINTLYLGWPHIINTLYLGWPHIINTLYLGWPHIINTLYLG